MPATESPARVVTREMQLANATVLVIGAGTMGTGIAQVAAQAGHHVFLFDMRAEAAMEAKLKLGQIFNMLVTKGKMTTGAAQEAHSRIEPVTALSEAAAAGLAIEAVVEQLDAKRAVFRELEGILAADAVLASNTSSISITALANGLRQPHRLIGMHFFNPVALMKLVEVVSGLHTAAMTAEAVFALAKRWGKLPVYAKSSPGFIVNRIARPFYAETLALLHERAATPLALDACMKGAGFRMGPCELMDLIGHDINLAATRSVYEANFFDKRYVPSLVQRDMVDGGLLGRKTGRGFYEYPAGPPEISPQAVEALAPGRFVTVHGDGIVARAMQRQVAHVLGRSPLREPGSNWTGVDIDGARLMLTDGRPAAAVAAHTGIADVALFDRPGVLPIVARYALAYSVNAAAGATWQAQAPAWLQALGFAPMQMADAPGLVVARTLAMLINEAADAVLQGVCTEDDADAAMKLGVNYPAGPFEWLREWTVKGAISVIVALDTIYRGERYRVSPLLQRRNG
jgi:3-hydroxybutyryl-CoA dehydrogenase